MTFGLRCSGPACRPHPASLPVRVPTVESLPPASFGFPLAVAPCGLATVAVIGPDWLLSSNKTLPMLGTPCGRPPGRPASRRTRASAAVQGDRPTKQIPQIGKTAVWRGFVGQERNAASGEPPCETLYPNLQ